ncbi:MAG: hypothetical protein A3J79_07570 [Elusimicrobia bacterium RIFOXYB2_FULL_62_6]|nr:MAG: hypothetical protein A3J79_07570 [Elusimicrobia bacterium RIFOXYB2_FULL_62_6]
MKRLLLFVFLLGAAGQYCRAEIGVGLGWPYAGVKYKFSKTALEAIGSADESVSLFAGRFYWRFARAGSLDIFTGLEGGRVSFDTPELTGKGYETAAFLGAEYYISKNISFSMDLAPTVIWLKAGPHESGGVEWVLNTALYFYIAPPKKKPSRAGAAETASLPGLAQAPADKPKLAVATFVSEDLEGGRGSMVSNMLESELLRSGRWEIIKRTDMVFILAEHGLTAGDLSRDETLIKLGKAVGARRLLCGSVSKGEKEQLVIRARLLDPETGMALGSETETAENIYTLMEAVRSLAAKLSEY